MRVTSSFTPQVLATKAVTRGAEATVRAETPEPIDGPPPPPREFRGAWVASVRNIDWPSRSGLSVAQQQAELRKLLDTAVQLKLNAVILQVRPEGDALYASPFEPWSEALSGKMGQAPEPFYDPLAFAVAEAHKRGIELHAWFNPFRARLLDSKGQASPAAANHVSRTNPEWVKRYGNSLWMDPGNAGVQDYAMKIMLDVVKRYGIDAVHLDDYFYPYPVRDANGKDVPFPDQASYQAYRAGGGQLAIADWRRENVNRFVERLYREVHGIKPDLKVGISPFGIWRPGNPPGIQGLDSVESLYADPRLWLQKGWMDYIVPQLYWPIEQKAQSFPVLLKWWGEQNTQNRQVVAGLYTSQVRALGAQGTKETQSQVGNFFARLVGLLSVISPGGGTKELPAQQAEPGASSNGWRADQIQRQIELTRQDKGAVGHAHFSMQALLRNNDNLKDKLAGTTYSNDVLMPTSPWLDAVPPAKPVVSLGQPDGNGKRQIEWEPGDKEAPWQWSVYQKIKDDWTLTVLPGANRRQTLDPASSAVAIAAVDRHGNESPRVTLPLTTPTTTPRIKNQTEPHRINQPQRPSSLPQATSHTPAIRQDNQKRPETP